MGYDTDYYALWFRVPSIGQINTLKKGIFFFFFNEVTFKNPNSFVSQWELGSQMSSVPLKISA